VGLGLTLAACGIGTALVALYAIWQAQELRESVVSDVAGAAAVSAAAGD